MVFFMSILTSFSASFYKPSVFSYNEDVVAYAKQSICL